MMVPFPLAELYSVLPECSSFVATEKMLIFYCAITSYKHREIYNSFNDKENRKIKCQAMLTYTLAGNFQLNVHVFRHKLLSAEKNCILYLLSE